MAVKNRVYLSIGSNVGNRLLQLTSAAARLQSQKTRIGRLSSAYETEPQNFANQPNFLNCAILLLTSLDPFQLLKFCQSVEREIGKNKKIAFGPRGIDVDILTFNDCKIFSKNLKLPHPRMTERNFVLTPLSEIAPQMEILGRPIGELMEEVSTQRVNFFAKLQNFYYDS
jgi:2-amino-4-hydroxy-6-hydroxymethyldihydropteridine diphosphokinase